MKEDLNMISSKQRSYLRGLAQQVDPTVYIGKQGLTENVIKEIDTGLNLSLIHIYSICHCRSWL